MCYVNVHVFSAVIHDLYYIVCVAFFFQSFISSVTVISLSISDLAISTFKEVIECHFSCFKLAIPILNSVLQGSAKSEDDLSIKVRLFLVKSVLSSDLFVCTIQNVICDYSYNCFSVLTYLN